MGSAFEQELPAQTPNFDTHWLSLRFRDGTIESLYLKKSAKGMVDEIWKCLPPYCFFCAMLMVGPFSELYYFHERLSEDQLVHRRWQASIVTYALTVPLLSMTVARYELIAFSDFGLEVLFSVAAICTFVPACMLDDWYLLQVRGADVQKALETYAFQIGQSDSRVLLALYGMVAASHLLVRIRWCILIMIEISSVSAYLFMCLYLGSSEPQWPQNLGLLTLLVLYSVAGKRNSEKCSRGEFVKLENEQRLRFETETKLEELEGARTSSACDDLDALELGTRSRHTDVELSCHLELIAEVGRREQWLVDHSQLRLSRDRVLGVGSFGIVVSGHLFEAPVAVKLPRRIHWENVGKDGFGVVRLGNELRKLRRVRHPNIVLFHGAYVDSLHRDVALVLEMVDGQLLPSYVNALKDGENQGRPDIAIGTDGQQQVMFGICLALRYLHALDPVIIHGKFKPTDIVVEASGAGPHSKLLDFGLSRTLGCVREHRGVMSGWMAPEVVLNPRDDAQPSCDVFSLGCILYFVLTGIAPMDGWSRQRILTIAKNRKPLRLNWPHLGSLEEMWMPIVSQCVQAPELRPCMDDVCRQCLAHPHYSTDRELPISVDLMTELRSKCPETSTQTSQGTKLTPGQPRDPERASEHRRSGRLHHIAMEVDTLHCNVAKSAPEDRLSSALHRITMEVDARSARMRVLRFTPDFREFEAALQRQFSFQLPTCLSQCLDPGELETLRTKLQQDVKHLLNGAGMAEVHTSQPLRLSPLLRDACGKQLPIVAKRMSVSVPRERPGDPDSLLVRITLTDFACVNRTSRSISLPPIAEDSRTLTL